MKKKKFNLYMLTDRFGLIDATSDELKPEERFIFHRGTLDQSLQLEGTEIDAMFADHDIIRELDANIKAKKSS